MSHTPYRIALILPAEPEYSNRLLEGAIAYAKKCREVELVEMPFIRLEGSSPLPDGALDFDGALVWLNVSDTWIEHLLREGIVVANVSGEWREKKLPTVAFDGLMVEKIALEHLVDLGCRQIAYIGTATSKSVESTQRQDRFLTKAARRGLEVASFETGPIDNRIDNRVTSLPKAAVEDLRRFLVGLSKPTAVWCEDDYLAHLVSNHAVEVGLRVPEDLAVLGLGDYSVARLGKPPISTIPLPGQLVGSRALELIHQILAGGKPARIKVTIPPPPVVMRESTGGGALTDKRFGQIRQRIHDNACEGLTVGDLVKMLPMSQVTFSRNFTRIFGHTPGEEIRRVKEERAKHYLRTTNFSIEHISELCGFSQPGKFSKFFRRQTGTTPREYRKGA